MAEYVALLRGINVGKAKRIAMAELRTLIEELGGANVRTLLNSGNVVFAASGTNEAKLAKQIAAALVQRFGFSARTTVITAKTLHAIVAENPLPEATQDASRFLVAFVSDKKSLADMRPLCERSWLPDRIALGKNAAYLWCPGGILESQLLKAHGKLTGEHSTTRNWATVQKIAELMQGV